MEPIVHIEMENASEFMNIVRLLRCVRDEVPLIFTETGMFTMFISTDRVQALVWTLNEHDRGILTYDSDVYAVGVEVDEILSRIRRATKSENVRIRVFPYRKTRKRVILPKLELGFGVTSFSRTYTFDCVTPDGLKGYGKREIRKFIREKEGLVKSLIKLKKRARRCVEIEVDTRVLGDIIDDINVFSKPDWSGNSSLSIEARDYDVIFESTVGEYGVYHKYRYVLSLDSGLIDFRKYVKRPIRGRYGILYLKGVVRQLKTLSETVKIYFGRVFGKVCPLILETTDPNILIAVSPRIED